MKSLLVVIAAFGLPSWVSSVLSGLANEQPRSEDKVVVVTESDAPDGGKVRFVRSGDGAVAVVKVKEEKQADGRSEGIVRVRTTGDRKDGGSERGWLGISIDAVSDTLARQLSLEGEGVVVLNVVEDSPAARAGLEPHDVLLRIDGEAVPKQAGRAVQILGQYKPGDVVDVVVLREGRERTLSVELGRRAGAPAQFRWRAAVEPEAEIEDNVVTRGKIVRKNAEGEWVVEDLGDIAKIEKLPQHIRMFLPEKGKQSTRVYVENEEKVVETRVKRDEEEVVVRREGDGPIVVTRIEDGQETTSEYGSPAELKEADPEAYRLFRKAGKAVFVHVDVDGFEEPLADFDFKFEFDEDTWNKHGEAWTAHAEVWKKELEEHLAEAHESYEAAMEQVRKQLKAWEEHGGLPPEIDLPPLAKLFSEQGDLPRQFGRFHWIGKPRHTFEVLEDGRIEVRLRRGDSELVLKFEDEDDLADRRPKLYEKFRHLQDADHGEDRE